MHVNHILFCTIAIEFSQWDYCGLQYSFKVVVSYYSLLNIFIFSLVQSLSI